jgi:hypothetical protein
LEVAVNSSNVKVTIDETNINNSKQTDIIFILIFSHII